MSWQIHCFENTVKISAKVAKAVYKADEDEGEFFSDPSEVTYEDHLQFNPDHSEHQDYLSSCPKIVEVLKKAKVEGRIAFMDIEQAQHPLGDYWAHEFDGKGGYRLLRGTAEVTWVAPPKE